eukprot:TRINITY_DN63237_c0_g1_i1.p1 TRINITY_DN63237_c0_g1~~TRINITY_DN63237_c0_g1_i1.p1  ORF type:complete len:692 (-),score=98.90 TRINITY_DN63237_c0_g1_i1:860-2935(-)
MGNMCCIPWPRALGEDDQLLITSCTSQFVKNGPGIKIVPPFCSSTGRKARTLSELQYVTIMNDVTGELRNVVGPTLLFLGPHDSLEQKPGEQQIRTVITLERHQYAIIMNERTGERRLETGEARLVLGPTKRCLKRDNALSLTEMEYVTVNNNLDGTLRNELGPKLCFLGPHESLIKKPGEPEVRSVLALGKDEFAKVLDEFNGEVFVLTGQDSKKVVLEPRQVLQERGKAITLDEMQYVTLSNNLTGEMTNVLGPQQLFLGPHDEIVKKAKEKPVRQVIALGKDEYAKVLNEFTGERRVEKGEGKVWLAPTEILLEKKRGCLIDEHHAVLVRDTDSSDLTLHTKPGLFIPGPYQEIVEEQIKIILEEYETVVLKNNTGLFNFRCGKNQEERAFFVPPFHEIVTLNWTKTDELIHSNRAGMTTQQVWKFDSRPTYMNYEFECRTADNVELVMDVTFFWKIINVEAMIRNTADAPGDVCTHARSMIIQAVSAVKLMYFLQEFNKIVRECILSYDDKFYTERGVEILSAEVMKFSCSDPQTQKTLSEINQETTNRLKSLEKQRSDNEVALAKVHGEIEEEKCKAELIDLRKSHVKREAYIEGEAEGGKIKAFMDLIAEQCSPQQKLELYALLRKQEAITALSTGNATLYYTPNDVNLSIEHMVGEHIGGQPQTKKAHKRAASRAAAGHADFTE